MFKKKVGRPSNAYKRKIRNIKIISLVSIFLIICITISGLNYFIKYNNLKLKATVVKEDDNYKYECLGDFKDNGSGCQKYLGKGVPKCSRNDAIYQSSDNTCEYKEKLCDKGYYSEGACVDVAFGNGCSGGNIKFHNGKRVCYYGSVSCNGTVVGNFCKKRTTEGVYYSCDSYKTALITYTVSSVGSDCYGYIGYTKTPKTVSSPKKAQSNPSNKKTKESTCMDNCKGIGDPTGKKVCEEKCKNEDNNNPSDESDDTPTKGGNDVDDSTPNNETPTDENNNTPSNEEQPKVLPELKIINSKKENLTNKERKRNLCTNTPLYISGAKTSEVTYKSDKLKITNSSEKTSTDKAIIEPLKEIKKGEKVDVTVIRSEDNKEAKVTFVNTTDCNSLKTCKKLSKININHGMTIMNKKVITMKKGGYFGLNLEVYPINIKASEIVWETSNSNIVEIKKISDQGIQIYAKAKSNKAVKISATLGGKTTYLKVKVKNNGYDNPGGYDNASKIVDCTYNISIEDAKVEISSQKYTGKVITPIPKVTLNSKELKYKEDFELSYSNNVNPGEAKVRIIGKGIYKNSKVVTFKIIKEKQVKISNIDITYKTRNLSDTTCTTKNLKVKFTNKDNINIENVYYSTDNGKTWNVLKSEKEGPNATISLNKTYNYLLIKVKDEEGNYSKIYGPYNINIQKSCNTLKKVTTIKISGIKKGTNTLSKNKKIKVKIQAKSNIKTVQISNDGKKTWVVSKKCTINKNEATCNIDSKHKSLYYRVITVNNEYQDFGEYIIK